MLWIAVAVGGALGSVVRHWVNLEMTHRPEQSVPYATFVVNLAGCLLIGVLAGLIAGGTLAPDADDADVRLRGCARRVYNVLELRARHVHARPRR